MRYEVLLTEGAEHDLEELYDYIAKFDSKAAADFVLDQLMEAADGLASFPERGSHPRELLAMGIREYRQILFKPYRLIYRIVGDHQVFIHLIADGRRNLQPLLARRLLSS